MLLQETNKLVETRGREEGQRFECGQNVCWAIQRAILISPLCFLNNQAEIAC